MLDWHYIVIKNKTLKLLDIIPKGISDEDMEQLIKDWNLKDSEQQSCYRNAVPKQQKMLLEASVIVIPLLKQKTDILHSDKIYRILMDLRLFGVVLKIFCLLQLRKAMDVLCVFRLVMRGIRKGSAWLSK